MTIRVARVHGRTETRGSPIDSALADLLRSHTTGDASTTKSAQRASAAGPTSSGLRLLVGRAAELEQLGEMLAAVAAGGSAALVVRGEPGVGKSALLEQLIASASGFQIVRAEGVEGEVDLPYAGLHQLCRPLADAIGALPQPQAEALRVAFGLSSAPAPDRFMVGLATLTLMSEAAANQPLLCVVDDAQWLDPETTRALAFVARRLGADSVGLVFASREIVDDLDGVPELQLGGLSAADSRTLLDSVLVGHLDATVRERFLAETHGNPLALIELPRALTPAEAASGVLHQGPGSLSSRIEDSFRRQLEPLPDETRRLLLLAAAEPLGDPLLLVRAASELGLSVESADPAEAAGLFQIRERCSFRHPLVRSAVYGAATPSQRRTAHGALAVATDSERDADRKAWHRAQATATPDEDVATELERTAARAKARGGLAAAGAFLQRAAMLTPDSDKRAERTLAAADALYEAGAFNAVENLLRAFDGMELDELHAARAELLSVQVSLSLTTSGAGDLLLRLLAVAERLMHLDAEQANGAHLEALRWAFGGYSDPEFLRALVEVLTRSPASESGAVVDLILRGWGELLEHGFPAGTDLLGRAMVALRDAPQLQEADLPVVFFSEGIARSMWDLDSWETLTRRGVQLARDVGALSILPGILSAWAGSKIATGEFPGAALAVAESEAITDATGANGEEWGDAVLSLSAWQLGEADALRRIDEVEGRVDSSYFPEYTRALAYNAAGHYERALAAAQRSNDLHPIGAYSWALVELVEAAARCDQPERARVAFEQLAERTRLASTDWALGVEARSGALFADEPAVAESLYREAIERLARAGARPDLARARLVFGEWLRRQGRRLDAREQLRTAYELFSEMGSPSFAERARRELVATGETARKRTDETRGDLTAQESQIAQLASDGLTNPEIGAKLFLSPRTVEWHLRRVYPKLGISSRKELRTVLSAG